MYDILNLLRCVFWHMVNLNYFRTIISLKDNHNCQVKLITTLLASWLIGKDHWDESQKELRGLAFFCDYKCWLIMVDPKSKHGKIM